MELEKQNEKLYIDICQLMDEVKEFVAHSANKTMTLLYWKIGDRINNELLDGERAEYGKQIVSQLATQLKKAFGKRGLEERNIRRMMQFASLFDNMEIVSQAATQLSWSHFIELLQLEKSGIKVAEYLTELPDLKLLKQKLQQELELKRQMMDNRKKNDNE